MTSINHTYFSAIASNDFEAIQSLLHNEIPVENEVLSRLIQSNNVTALHAFVDGGYPKNLWLAGHASVHGSIDCLRYLISKGWPLDIAAIRFAGTWECMKAVIEAQDPFEMIDVSSYSNVFTTLPESEYKSPFFRQYFWPKDCTAIPRLEQVKVTEELMFAAARQRGVPDDIVKHIMTWYL